VEWYRCINKSKCDAIEKNATSATYATVSSLTLHKTYKLKVFSISSVLQNVSDDKWKFAEINFTLTGLYHDQGWR
jgi:hypothetical protein